MLMVSLLPLAITSFTLLSNASSSLKQQAFNQLESVREIKKGQIESYFSVIDKQLITLAENPTTIKAMSDFSERFDALAGDINVESKQFKQYKESQTSYYTDAFSQEFEQKNNIRPNVKGLIPNSPAQIIAQYLYISNNSNALGNKHKLFDAKDGSSYSQAHAQYHPIFKNILERFGFDDIFLVDATTGNIVYSVYKEIDYATSLETGAYNNSAIGQAYRKAKASSNAGSSFLIDFDNYGPSYDAPASFISTPIFKTNSKELLGVLIFQMPIDNINAIMQEKAGFGESGETYLLGDDLLMRSQSRFSEENTIFSTKVDTEAASQVFAGKKDSVLANDYRGIPVLSSYTPVLITGLKWALLAEIDEAEILSSTDTLTQLVALALLLLFWQSLALFGLLCVVQINSWEQIQQSCKYLLKKLQQAIYLLMRMKNRLNTVFMQPCIPCVKNLSK